MKKRILQKILLLIITSLLSPMLFAQCGTIMVNSSQLQYPDTITNLPVATIGNPYQSTIQFFSPTSVSGIAVNRIVINAVVGLPAGFSSSTSPSNGILFAGNSGCVIIQSSNVNLNTGTYPFTINTTVYFQAGGSAPLQITGYKLVVNSAAQIGPYYSGWYSHGDWINASTGGGFNRYVNFLMKDSLSYRVDQSANINRSVSLSAGAMVDARDPLLDSYDPNLKVNILDSVNLDSIVIPYFYVRNTDSITIGANTKVAVKDTLIITWYTKSNIRFGTFSSGIKYSMPLGNWDSLSLTQTNYFKKDTIILTRNDSTTVNNVGGGFENSWELDEKRFKAPNNMKIGFADTSKVFGYSIQFRSGVIGADTGVMIYQRDPSLYPLPPGTKRPNYFGYLLVTEQSQGSWSGIADQSFTGGIEALNRYSYVRTNGWLGHIPGNAFLIKRHVMASFKMSSFRNYTPLYSVSDTNICKGKTITFNLLNCNLFKGSTNLGTGTIQDTPSQTTTYVIKNNAGQSIKTYVVTVTDLLNLQISTTGNFSAATNTLVLCGLNSIFTIGANTNYTASKQISWQKNGVALTNQNIIESFTDSGTYKLIVTTPTGCRSELTFPVTKLNSTFNPNFSSNRQVVTAPPFDFTFANQTQPLNDYNYFWKWGDGITDSTNNQILFKTYSNNGQYTVKLIAQHKVTGCKDSITKVNYISCSGANPQPLGLTTIKQNPYCAGEATGSITVNGSGGTLPYTYRINAGTYQSSNTFANLVAGIYTIDIKDAANNVATKKDTLVNPPVVTVGGITGLNNVPVSSIQSYSIAAQSGASYLWSVLNGTLLSGNGTTAIQVQWPAGSGVGKIIVSVNKGNCGATDSLTISISPQPLGVTSTKQNPLCAGEATGSITVNGSGGTAAYTYRINGGTYQTSNTFNNLIAGIYTIDVKDAINNTVTKKDTLTNPPAIIVGGINGLNGVPVSSVQSYNVSAQLGTTYSWSVVNGTLLSGNGTNAIQVQWSVNSGIGKVNIGISKNNCTAFDSLLISIGANPLTVLSSKQNESCPGTSNGSISIAAAGGTPPYVYSLNNGSYQTNNTFSNLVGGVYLIQTKDNNQVVAFKYDTITSGTKPVAGIITGPTTVATLAINNYIVGQQTGVNYLWNVTGGVVASGQNTNVVQLAWGAQSMVGKVAVKVTNAGGCSDSSDLNVNVGSVGTNELSISNKVQIYPNPNNGSFAIDVLNSNIEQVDIFNSIGQLIWSYTSNETKQSVLEVRLKTTPGIYTVSVKTESGVVNQKLILTQ